jgi:hypothetical protein
LSGGKGQTSNKKVVCGKEKTYVNEKQKIVPHPLLEGRFSFNAITGLAKTDRNQNIIWGFNDNIVNFDKVLSMIGDKYIDEFSETVFENATLSKSPIIYLKNGNKIQEIYHKKFIRGKNGDYEFGSLESVEGITRLVA